MNDECDGCFDVRDLMASTRLLLCVKMLTKLQLLTQTGSKFGLVARKV